MVKCLEFQLAHERLRLCAYQNGLSHNHRKGYICKLKEILGLGFQFALQIKKSAISFL